MKTFLYIFEIVGDLSWGHRTHYSVHVRVDGFVPSAMEFLGSLDIRYHICIYYGKILTSIFFIFVCLFVCTIILYACLKGHLDVVRELLCADGIQVNRSLTDGQPPVFAAAEKGHSEVIKLLVAAGADVNACG
jgi:hypothetical protein